jgi:thermostable 8-oxoguanine DNA glycosylase
MIDPTDVTKYDRTNAELEEFFLFCVVVAGKTAMVQARLLENFLQSLPHPDASPFERIFSQAIRGQGLMGTLKASRLGQFNRLHKCFLEAIATFSTDPLLSSICGGSMCGRTLRDCTVEDLEGITGIGPKTARFFLLHTRENEKIAALDTHILHYMRDQGIDTPKGTPSKGAKYRALELKFVELAEASGMSVADFDLKIWRQYSGN